MSNTLDKIKIMQAAEDGRTPQRRILNSDSEWEAVPFDKAGNYVWNFFIAEHRIKPEPITCWAVIDKNCLVIDTRDSRNDAERFADNNNFRVIKMQEVPE